MRTYGTLIFLLLGFNAALGRWQAADSTVSLRKMSGEELQELILLWNRSKPIVVDSTLISTRFILGRIDSTWNRKINASVIIQNCFFKEDCKISNMNFSNELRISGCTFARDIQVNGCIFSENTNFSENVFEGQTEFIVCTFRDDVDFSFSAFGGEASFTNSTIVSPAGGTTLDFSGTRWSSYLNLAGLRAHNATIDLYGAEWDNFWDTLTSGVITLTDAEYGKLRLIVASRYVPKPLLRFHSFAGFGTFQETYIYLLNKLGDEGAYVDHDILFKEYHDRETRYYLSQFEFLSAAINFGMGTICGYGIDPKRALRFSFWIVLIFATIYRLPISYRNIHPRYEKDKDSAVIPPSALEYGFKGKRFVAKIWEAIAKTLSWLSRQFRFFMNFILFSVNTFCTVGYDNNYPVGWLRYVCMLELILGYITLTLFLVSMVNVLMR